MKMLLSVALLLTLAGCAARQPAMTQEQWLELSPEKREAIVQYERLKAEREAARRARWGANDRQETVCRGDPMGREWRCQ